MMPRWPRESTGCHGTGLRGCGASHATADRRAYYKREQRRGQLAERGKHWAVPQFGPPKPETPLPFPAHPGLLPGEEQNRWPIGGQGQQGLKVMGTSCNLTSPELRSLRHTQPVRLLCRQGWRDQAPEKSSSSLSPFPGP